MRVLLTNDDGVQALGINAMRRRLATFADVTVVAPASEQSAVGHSITLLTPLVVQELHEDGVPYGFAVEGKPADCIKLGLVHLVKEPPDLVVSGINAGSNAGINVLYSGTVAAAVEASFFGVTAVAVSLTLPEPEHYARAAELAEQVIRDIVAAGPQPGELFNVNIPDLSKGDPLGVTVCEQGLGFYKECYEARSDPRGRTYYWLLPDSLGPGGHTESDLAYLAARRITVTPLHFDLTDRARLRRMQDWTWSPIG